jgi:hypothetical protein
MFICVICGSDKVFQQVSFLVDANADPEEELVYSDPVFEDYYWCEDCGWNVDVECKEENKEKE